MQELQNCAVQVTQVFPSGATFLVVSVHPKHIPLASQLVQSAGHETQASPLAEGTNPAEHLAQTSLELQFKQSKT